MAQFPENKTSKRPSEALSKIQEDDLVLLDGTSEHDAEAANFVPAGHRSVPSLNELENHEKSSRRSAAAQFDEENIELETIDVSKPQVSEPAPAPASAPATVERTATGTPAGAAAEQSLPQPTGERARRVTNQPKYAGNSRRKSPLPFAEILGETFTQRPRIRIVAGFILALMLGGIWPGLYSASVKDCPEAMTLKQRIVNVKTYPQIYAKLPKYQSLDDLNSDLASLRKRQRLNTIFFWGISTSVLAVAWFKLT